MHNNSELPKKKSKKNPLTKNDKKNNRRLAGERVVNENVICILKLASKLLLINIEIDVKNSVLDLISSLAFIILNYVN
ncbi:hypothetical protein [Orientia tsutsugamushi]|uniref:hypothetical protein n=1 Tax=Orientia tsutsugamushi TaxID=784 RepID=UPI0035BE7A65